MIQYFCHNTALTNAVTDFEKLKQTWKIRFILTILANFIDYAV